MAKLHVIQLDDISLEYLQHVLTRHAASGLPIEELAPAAMLVQRVHDHRTFDTKDSELPSPDAVNLGHAEVASLNENGIALEIPIPQV